MTEASTKYKVISKGLGTKKGQIPLNVRVSPDINKIVRSLPNRADFLRAAIAEKLEREGLLPETDNCSSP